MPQNIKDPNQEEEHEYLEFYREEILDKKAVYFVLFTVLFVVFTFYCAYNDVPTGVPELAYRFSFSVELGVMLLI